MYSAAARPHGSLLLDSTDYKLALDDVHLTLNGKDITNDYNLTYNWLKYLTLRPLVSRPPSLESVLSKQT